MLKLHVTKVNIEPHHYGEVEVAIVMSTPEEALEAAADSGEKAPSPKLVCQLLMADRLGLFPKGTELSRCFKPEKRVLSYLHEMVGFTVYIRPRSPFRGLFLCVAPALQIFIASRVNRKEGVKYT